MLWAAESVDAPLLVCLSIVTLRARALRRHALSFHTAGFAAPHVSQTHKAIGTTLGAIMWFWIFYKAREDGPVLLVRSLRAPRTLTACRAYTSTVHT